MHGKGIHKVSSLFAFLLSHCIKLCGMIRRRETMFTGLLAFEVNLLCAVYDHSVFWHWNLIGNQSTSMWGSGAVLCEQDVEADVVESRIAPGFAENTLVIIRLSQVFIYWIYSEHTVSCTTCRLSVTANSSHLRNAIWNKLLRKFCGAKQYKHCISFQSATKRKWASLSSHTAVFHIWGKCNCAKQ